MKKIIVTLISILFIHTVSAKSLYQQLCEFNYNWNNYANRAPNGDAVGFESDQDYVKTHLSYVLPILKSNPTNQFSAAQKRTRAYLIETLEKYRQAGVFPANHYREERTPIFIDENQTHCALGYLLKQTGFETVALEIAEEENYAWVKDIRHEAVPKLQVISGFTVEELKLIQGAYDSYMFGALFAPNKYEIPQKPEVMEVYFENGSGRRGGEDGELANVWCKGEGDNGILNGRWTQRFSAELPWIIGYFSNGKRTGQWREYYQGTDKLCRTENWRNDKLNGVRKRFGRDGELVEEILFKDGVAVTKTNYDLKNAIRYVRKPLDSTRVFTEVYTLEGALLASGNEIVHNPGGLLWFQNIELTALNTFAITARDISSTSSGNGGQESFIDPFSGSGLYNAPPLVEYKKEGEWVYYREYSIDYKNDTIDRSVQKQLEKDFHHYSNDLYALIQDVDELDLKAGYDSINVYYTANYGTEFFGYGKDLFSHISLAYHDVTNDLFYADLSGSNSWWSYSQQRSLNQQVMSYKVVSRVGQYNASGQRIGVWKHFDQDYVMYKTENYLIPWTDADIVKMVTR